MSKLILKTALTTIAAILLLFAITFGVLSLAFPATMVNICLDMNLTGMASGYAVMVYDRTGNVSDLALAAECAIYAQEDKQLISCMERLEQDEEWKSYLAEREESDEGYEQYLYGQYAVALYHQDQKEEAVRVALDASGYLHAFPKNNAVIALAVEAIAAHDSAVCKALWERLILSSYMNEDMENIIALLQKEINE